MPTSTDIAEYRALLLDETAAVWPLEERKILANVSAFLQTGDTLPPILMSLWRDNGQLDEQLPDGQDVVVMTEWFIGLRSRAGFGHMKDALVRKMLERLSKLTEFTDVLVVLVQYDLLEGKTVGEKRAPWDTTMMRARCCMRFASEAFKKESVVSGSKRKTDETDWEPMECARERRPQPYFNGNTRTMNCTVSALPS